MSCQEGNIINCINTCVDCDKPTMQNLANRNENCLEVCGATLKHAFANNKSICQCNPRTRIKPCTMDDDYERKKCFLKNGYQYWDEECAPNVIGGNDYGYQKPTLSASRYILPPKDNSVENYTFEGEPQVQSIGGGGIQTNYYNFMGCDYTFPYDNDIKLKYKTPFKGKENYLFNKPDGGYIKYDKLTDNIVLISMNARQGGDEIGRVGIMRTPAIDPEFQAETLSAPCATTVEGYCNNNCCGNYIRNSNINADGSFIYSPKPLRGVVPGVVPKVPGCNYLNINIKEEKNAETLYSKEDTILESNLDNKFVSVSKKGFTINFDFFKCQYGYIRLVDPDFDNNVHNYSVYGLGPISSDNTKQNFSLDWTAWARRRCNEAFGSQQSFGINGSHWPVMYVTRYNRVTLEQKNYLMFCDHFRKCEWFFDDLNTTGEFKIRTREPEFRFYVCIEDTILDLRKQFMKIVGPPQPPIQKSMGHWVGGFGYENWKMIEDDIKILRENKFPVDGFILDLYWYGHAFPYEKYQLDETNYADNFCHRPSILYNPNKLGAFEWDTIAFPDPFNYINNELMGKYNYGLTQMIEPYVNANNKDFSFMLHNNMIAKLENGSFAEPNAVMQNWIGDNAVMVDFTNPETSKYWFTSRIAPNISTGTFNWWNDLTEPECYNENAFYLGIGQVNNKGEMMHELHQAPDVLNFNQLLWMKGVCEMYNKTLNKRYNVNVRSGTCGIQRYGAFMWPGDEVSSLKKMNSSTASFLTLSLCGLDFVTTDAGGFAIGGNKEDELYSIWFANAAATRFNLKPHKWWTSRDIKTSSPAVWGDVQSNLENTIERYLLSPYYYSCAMNISKFGENKGDPLCTTLYFRYQLDDPELFTIANYWQYNGEEKIYGPSLLYVTLTNYYEKEPAKQDMYLPKDTVWYDYRHKVWIEGGKYFVLPYKKNQLPLLIRNNSIVPTRTPNQESVNMRFDDVLTSYDVYIYSYLGKDAEEFILYIDDGISMNKNQLKIRLNYKNGVALINIPSVSNFKIPNFNFFLVDSNGTSQLSNNNIRKIFYNQLNNVREGYNGNGGSSNNDKIVSILLIVIITVLAYFLGKTTCNGNKSRISKFTLIGTIIGLILAVMLVLKN